MTFRSALLAALVLGSAPALAQTPGRGDVFVVTTPHGARSEVVLAVEGPRALVMVSGRGRWVPVEDWRSGRHAPLAVVANPYRSVLVPTRVERGEAVAFRNLAVDRVVTDATGGAFAVTSALNVIPLTRGTNVDVTALDAADLDFSRAIPVRPEQTIEQAILAYDRSNAARAGFKAVRTDVRVDHRGTFGTVDVAAFRADADESAAATSAVVTSHAR